MSRSIFVVRPPVVDGLDLDILGAYRIYDHFALAAELWRLAARPERASAIEEVVSRAHDYDVPLLTTPDIEKMLALLVGLDDSIYGAITDTDERHEIPLDQLRALRGRTKRLDLSESRGNDAVFAVQEALVHVHNLQSALRSALEQDAHIVFE